MLAAPSAAQSTHETDAHLSFLDTNQQPLAPDFVVVRDSNGEVLELTPGQYGEFVLQDVGRKISLEFTARGGKSRSMELVLEQAPKVYVTLVIDSATGRIKEFTQKPYFPTSQPGKKLRQPGVPGSIGLLVPPANDACATPLPIMIGATAFDTTEATTDGPTGACTATTTIHNDIWYDFLAPASGVLTATTCNAASYDTKIAIYAGTGCPPGAPLACNDDTSGCGLTSRITTAVVAGQTYLLRVGGFGSTSRGTGTVSLSLATPPANDECAGAAPVGCNSFVAFNNSLATTNVTDPAYSCRVGGPAQGVGTMWFTFVPPGATAVLDTSLSTVSDTLLGLYSGSCGSLVEIGCDDDGGTGFRSLINAAGLTPGATYYVQVSSYSSSSLGDIRLDISCSAGPPPGDACEDAIEVACGGSATFNNALYTTDPLDPAYSCSFGGPAQGFGTAWLTFVATDTSAAIDTNDSLAADTLLAVYDGTCGAFTELACSDDEGIGLLSQLCVEGLTIGQTYYIQASSFSAADTGEITVTVECPCPAPPANDDCVNAEALVMPASVLLDNTLATDDIAVPCGVFSGPWKNVWYVVQGTGNILTATTCNGGTVVSDTKISVFCGDCGELVCVGGNDDACGGGGPVFASTVNWCSQAGATYLVTVGNFSSTTTPGQIQLDVFDTFSSCEATIQCLPEGACCLADGTCVTTTADDCAAQGGTYQGDGVECDAEFVADGSFEAGAFSGNWAEFSTNFGTPLCDASCGFGGGTGPRTGSWWAWFGGTFEFEEGSLEQNVTIPVGATDLEFYLEIPVSSGNGVDFLRVLIDGITVFEVLENDPIAGVGYNLVQVPIGAFADGGVHALRFESIITGGATLTNFFVDDVSLSVGVYDCTQCTTLDFTTEDDGVTPLGNGQTISTPPEFGTLVSISSAGANSGAAIFDSTPGGPNDPSQDRDLLVGLGNMLYLQNDQVPTQVGGFFTTPNDDQDGGDLVFTFASPVSPQSVVLVDIDVGTAQASSVVLTDVFGYTRTYTVPSQWTEDILINGGSGWRTLDLTTLAPQPGFASVATAAEQAGFDASQVVTMRVHLGSSGAVDDLTFCD